MDIVTLTPLSSKVPEQQISEEVIPLNEYKFDHNKLVVNKWNPKREKTLVGGVERELIEEYEERTLWDIWRQDIYQVGVETLAMIEGMAMVGQLSSEAMVKEIIRLKQLVAQL